MSSLEARRQEAYSLNSGVNLYLLNSSSHSWELSGGRIPVTGRHSVMLSPDSVRRVTPPTTTTPMTKMPHPMSQLPTLFEATSGAFAASPFGIPIVVRKGFLGMLLAASRRG